MNDTNRRAGEIFDAALERPPGERAARVQAACAGDESVRRRVEALLRAHDAAGAFMEEPAAPPRAEPAGCGSSGDAASLQEPAGTPPGDGGPPGGARASREEAVGRTLGHYKLLEKIGEGGCGVVYVAEQSVPVRRRVALKVIKLGMDTKAVVARFETERQAMAMMDHPNIAQVYDAGTSATGRPFFVMELVRGIRITDYCDQALLSTKDRLDLFIKVCQAIQHAHQKGVIHRDIKPSNILVTLHDGVPVPKVIDFGIAKATEGRLTDHTVYTQLNQFIGTPAYMSPEQAEMTGLDIDTRSDIYSLGVLLYELLAGSPPFDPTELMASGIDAMRKIILETEPVRPSTRFGTMSGADSTTAAKRRATDSSRLLHQLKGDLDWIVMKCLEKDRTRRYDTASGLAMDLRRHIKNEPVLARSPTAGYRLQTAWRRHKALIAAVVLMTAVLSAATGISAWQAVRARGFARSEAAQHRRADEALLKMEIQKSETLFAAEDSSAALAYLARSARRNPSNEVSAARLFSALTRRDFSFSLVEPLQHLDGVVSAQFSPDGRRLVTASRDHTARVWDARSGQPVSPPLHHTDFVDVARFSPDGRRVVTASRDNTARIWDAETGAPLTPPLSHEDWFIEACFSPDGRWVVTASRDHTARVWESETGRPLGEPLRHGGDVSRARFSPDGRRVLTASDDHTARIWDAQTGRPLTDPLRHEDRVLDAQFSPDGRQVVTASFDKTARLWDAQTGRSLTAPLQHHAVVGLAQFSPDGARLATSGEHTARIWDSKTLQPLTEPLSHADTIWDSELSVDGQRLVTASWDRTARVWDAQTGRVLTEPLRHGDRVLSARFSPDGRQVVTASSDKTARVWELRRPQVLAEPIRFSAQVNSADFSPDGRRLATGGDDNSARVWDARTGQPVTEPLRHGKQINSIRFSPDGLWLLTASIDGTARVWDARTGRPRAGPLEHKGNVHSAQFSPDGRRVVTGADDNTARIWDAETGGLLAEPLRHEDHVVYVGFSPDGRRVVTASKDKAARVWDAQTGRSLAGPLQHSAAVASAEFSPDGRRILTASEDNTARVWDAQTGRPLTEPLRHEDQIRSAHFSPDGRWVVTASLDRSARVWDAQSGQPVAEPLRHEDEVRSARFSPDGRRVVTASLDKTARVWDAQTGQALTEPLQHAGRVNTAQFSPDGQQVVTTSFDKTARVWDTPDVPLPVPEWVLNLTEAIAGQALDERGILRRVPVAELLALKREVTASASRDVWTRWGQWFFADPETRAISPFSAITVPEYVRRRIQENTLESLREAVLLSPENGLAWARLGLAVLVQTTVDHPGRVKEAAWFSLRAVRFAPGEAEAWELRGDVLAEDGHPAEALGAYDRCVALAPATNAAPGLVLQRVAAKRDAVVPKLGH